MMSTSRALWWRWAAVILLPVAGCQSVQDGARKVSLGAQDLGKKMAAPFQTKSPSSPNFGDRSPGYGGEQDPFLPPPKRPDDPAEVSDLTPRPLKITLGKPRTLPQPLIHAAQFTQ